MLIVADTSPINYLVLIEAESVLHTLYGSILIPDPVLLELKSAGASGKVRNWAAAPPSWLTIRNPQHVDLMLPIDPGEAAAISLAREIGADRLLIDDRDGRAIARSMGLPVAGTLAVLRDAASAGVLDLRQALGRLAKTSFRASASLYEQILAEHEKRTP